MWVTQLLFSSFSGLRAGMGAGNSMMNDLTIIQTTQVAELPSCVATLTPNAFCEFAFCHFIRLVSPVLLHWLTEIAKRNLRVWLVRKKKREYFRRGRTPMPKFPCSTHIFQFQPKNIFCLLQQQSNLQTTLIQPSFVSWIHVFKCSALPVARKWNSAFFILVVCFLVGICEIHGGNLSQSEGKWCCYWLRCKTQQPTVKKKKNQSKISREHIISVPKVWRAVKSTNSVLFSRWARIAGTILVNRGVKVYLYSVFTPTPYVVSNNWEEFVDVLLHTIFYKIVWAFNVYYFDQLLLTT